ncbi:PREDICTED: uncharacterized protein LOC105453290 isoform X4 [Wasmannia auropunctata]|uniref:uncharacterized protein LOC105453290 isoform X4 n=1 Tax=Wasmannia auropunctata TaxID=64793 RepID=UPI0005EFEF60|nr:PREDICTED: uncharacterized protein LOC105453290 isoform X4 [Wasmannia auropunctata]XP_011693416.1 PREDICTED: uncharacterized protein LOC105453290 isoform X4 [Wasmannia auropunctata]XP_011693418.1 PREDICTED: uncharacterized protein LOC105453290 isoform X4 [Wasmannia auropunctata]XP_011693419.1 PREDICTED: uncharacterized protein LOC105453290 isoform X4 [Wasmannia auropunctata]XP_011693420.1 PREDICTED: uncharacterized protein LOC105453290 isoform X4 [Wasmannia auropunctata]
MATTTKQTIVGDEDDTFYYIGVKASPFATDCAVFGLSPKEIAALRTRFPLAAGSTNVLNAIMLKGTPFSVINALAELGYRVICTTGDAEILWTMQREN